MIEPTSAWARSESHRCTGWMVVWVVCIVPAGCGNEVMGDAEEQSGYKMGNRSAGTNVQRFLRPTARPVPWAHTTPQGEWYTANPCARWAVRR